MIVRLRAHEVAGNEWGTNQRMAWACDGIIRSLNPWHGRVIVRLRAHEVAGKEWGTNQRMAW